MASKSLKGLVCDAVFQPVIPVTCREDCCHAFPCSVCMDVVVTLNRQAIHYTMSKRIRWGRVSAMGWAGDYLTFTQHRPHHSSFLNCLLSRKAYFRPSPNYRACHIILCRPRCPRYLIRYFKTIVCIPLDTSVSGVLVVQRKSFLVFITSYRLVRYGAQLAYVLLL